MPLSLPVIQCVVFPPSGHPRALQHPFPVGFEARYLGLSLPAGQSLVEFHFFLTNFFFLTPLVTGILIFVLHPLPPVAGPGYWSGLLHLWSSSSVTLPASLL